MEDRSRKPRAVHVEDKLIEQLVVPLERLSLQSSPPPQGRVIIHCLRHAQAKHNVPLYTRNERLNIKDPGLTKAGFDQARQLRNTLGSVNTITHILCSPLRRTLQTALLGFSPILRDGLKVTAYPDIREWGSSPCSTGSKMDDLLRKTPNADQLLDTSLVPSGWEVNSESKKNAERVERVKKDLWLLGNESLKESGGRWRGRDVMRRGGIENVEIVIVSHAAFLGTLEGTDVERLRNAQWRTYEFATEEEMQLHNCKPYAIFETPESKKRNDPVVPTAEEVLQLHKKILADKAKDKVRAQRRGW